MLYTYILDDSIESPTLFLTADHSTLLFLPGFFYQIKNFLFFCGWASTWSVTNVTLPLFPPPPPSPPANFWQVPKNRKWNKIIFSPSYSVVIWIISSAGKKVDFSSQEDIDTDYKKISTVKQYVVNMSTFSDKNVTTSKQCIIQAPVEQKLDSAIH